MKVLVLAAAALVAATTMAAAQDLEAGAKEYIQAPMAKIPGTKMVFAGIKNEKEIADLWAYLKQFKADGSK
jgi:cytochrome c2